MKIAREDHDEVVILRLDGKLMGGPDAGTMKTAIGDAVEEGKRAVLVDLAKVPLINSTGLGILVSSQSTLRNHEGTLKLLNVPTRIASALQTTWLDRVFESFDDEGSAIASFRG